MSTWGGDPDRAARVDLDSLGRRMAAEIGAVARELWAALRGCRGQTHRAGLADAPRPPTIGRLD